MSELPELDPQTKRFFVWLGDLLKAVNLLGILQNADRDGRIQRIVLLACDAGKPDNQTGKIYARELAREFKKLGINVVAYAPTDYITWIPIPSVYNLNPA